jgi:ABC-2 type transport system ATP-binding protein
MTQTVTGPAIEVRKLAKTYGRGARAVPALADVSLSVAPGEIYGLLGRNGAGKTTLVKILLDIVRPSRGATFLRGISSRSTASRRTVGYLPEDHRFPEYQTGLGLLSFYASLSGAAIAGDKERLQALLASVDLADAADRRVRTYSKGMKQRLGLAQALVHDPEILFLDEPTDGVDPVGRAKIRDMLLVLKSRGKTIFLNSHLLSEVERVCDRVGIMERGVLLKEGTPDALTRVERAFALETSPELDDAQLAELARLVHSATRAARGLEVIVGEERDIDAVVD